MSHLPIADYGLLSDRRSAALVSRDGSIDWLCLPRFDAPAIFARLLDREAGTWALRPVEEARIERRYLDRTLVLRTTFHTRTGVLVLEDAMALEMAKDSHRVRLDDSPALLRRLSCPEGEVEIGWEFEPRPEFGLVLPLFEEVPGGLIARGGPDVLVLSIPPGLDISRGRSSSVKGSFHLRQGERASFGLQRCPIWLPAPDPLREEEVEALLEETIRDWRRWSVQHQAYEGPWREEVHHSGRVLQALTFAPTGAIIAAPTTSLPEEIGGERNWDYRYTWIRDASLTLQALWVAACPEESARFFEFLAHAAMTRVREGGRLQIMFGIGGEHDLSERAIRHLSGWRESRPVRVGNEAWEQTQLDVYGELLCAAHLLRDQPGVFEPVNRAFLREVVDAASRRWSEPDQGIWEMRGPPRHHLYSKLMCWAALDRGIALAKQLEARDKVPAWSAVRDEIASAILEQGWSRKAGAFTQSFESDHLDASALRLPLVGFLPADDPRIRSTIEAIATRLVDDRGLIYRYLGPDGLPGEEGSFLLCTFWLAEAWAMAGELDRATETFERAASHANDLGLLSEEVDPATGELLGNFPQAFSHIGLVNAAWAIASQLAASGQAGRSGLHPGRIEGEPCGSGPGARRLDPAPRGGR